MADFLSTLFSGGAERDAANRNRASLNDYGVSSNDALNRGLERSIGSLTGQYGQADNRLGQNYGLYGDLRTAGTGILDRGKADSLAALGQAGDAYLPMEALAKKYGNATSLYQDSLGVNGAAGNANAVDAFHTGPAYDFTRDQGLEALNRRRAAAGMLNSGNADADAIKFGTGLADQTYGNWQDRLASFVNPELSATSGAATGRAGVATNIANTIGADTAARLGLESGVTSGMAGTNAARSANDIALGNSLAGLYTGDATNRVGIASNLTSGNMAASNQQAAGEAQGARNGLGAALSLASLAAGGAGGGSFGSLFGGGAGGLANPSRTSTFGFNPLSGAFSGL